MTITRPGTQEPHMLRFVSPGLQVPSPASVLLKTLTDAATLQAEKYQTLQPELYDDEKALLKLLSDMA